MLTYIWTLIAFALGCGAMALAGWFWLRQREQQLAQSHEARALLSQQERLAAIEAEAAEQQIESKRLRKYTAAYRKRLMQVADITPEEALEELKAEMLQSSEDEVREIRSDILFRSEEDARRESRRILIDVMQRMATEVERDVSATIVPIPNEDMKGRIIGREGRNIRAFEAATGVTLMIDETPGSILLSSFDPVRREVARLSLEHLIKDGRIHPAAIEETVERVGEQIKESVVGLGESALLKLRMNSVPPEVVALVGKLHFRHSNNQNTLEHSIEVAFLASLLASELGLDPMVAKRCGLFHDMGKAIDHEHEQSHASSAANILRRYGEDPRVVNAVEASHGETDETSVYASLLKIADSLSAARPGVRADAMDGYLQRVRSLEAIAKHQRGVVDAYAIQAGREIRVMVSPETIDDKAALGLARDIRRRIEEELHYPGTIKVTVIREARFADTAR